MMRFSPCRAIHNEVNLEYGNIKENQYEVISMGRRYSKYQIV